MRVKNIYFLFLLPLLIELFVCNARFWTFRFVCREPEYSLLSSISNMEGLERLDDNSFRITDCESGQHYLEFIEVNQDVRSVFLDISIPELSYAGCDIYVKDEGNAGYYHIPNGGTKYIVVPSVQESKWFQCYLYGKLHSLKIQFDEAQMEAGKVITISDICINRPKDMFFSIFRVCGMELLLALAVVFRKGSKYYSLSFDNHKMLQNILLVIVVLLQMIFFALLIHTASPYRQSTLDEGGDTQHIQYQELARAMADGHVYLDKEIPQWLEKMENPYDADARNKLIKEMEAEDSWTGFDNAYYNGRFYVYFGIVPVLLYYLPYFLIFQADLQNYIPILISWIIICIASARLIGTMIKKWFPQVPYILYLLITAIFPTSIGSMMILQRPGIYEVPISVGVMFAVSGLDLWLESVEQHKIVSMPKLFLGSVCIALTAGCRPTIFIVFMFSFLIFGVLIIQDNKISIQKYWKQAAVFSIPFLIVAAELMYYNKIRFGSAFDFGANYNLTDNDMTKKGHYIARACLGIFEFFLKPFNLSVNFPFIGVQGVNSSGYMGKISYCPDHGGILFVCPFFMFSVAAVIWRKKFRRYKQPYYFAILSLSLSVLLAFIAADIGGIYPRYKADFAFMVGIASVLAICMTDTCLAESGNFRIQCSWRWIVFLVCVVSALLNFLTFFSSIVYQLWMYNPHRFYTLKYIFEFWK